MSKATGRMTTMYRLLVAVVLASILEPAQAGVPIAVGPHTNNFRDIVQIFRKAEALIIVPPDAQQLANHFLDLLDDAGKRERLGARAQQVFQSQSGATSRTADALLRLLNVQPKATEIEREERTAP